jgi:DNA repair exonuclease SbcCD ATPase subunit
MKLISITIKNYRVHKELSVSFDAARTVVGGPNEAGKSTLVEAVHSAMFLRSRVTGAAHKAMLSEIHGGHPTVELVLESGGRTYAITKVFSGGQSGSTTLKEYASSSEASTGTAAKTRHNEDAEARIHEILKAEDVGGGRGVDQRLKHQWAGLWVWQESATRDPLLHANSDRHAQLLRERLSRLDGGGVLESPLDASVSSAVATRLTETFTDADAGRVRAGSTLDRAIKARQVADTAHAHAVTTVETLNASVDTIDAASRTIAACESELVQTKRELEDVRHRQREAAELGVEIAERQAATRAAEAAHAEAVRADQDIAACRREIAKLEVAMAPQLKMLATLEHEEVECGMRCDAATKEMSDAGQRHAHATAAYALQDAREKHARLLVERVGLGGRCERIAERRRKAKELEAELTQVPVFTAEDVADLSRLERVHEAAGATLQAIATKVEVLEASGPVTLAGEGLCVGTPVTITAASELAVGGPKATAMVRITPGGGRSLAEATQRFDEARSTLSAALTAHGIDSIDAAREAFARRQSLDADIHAVKLAIEGLGGVEADSDLAKLDADIEKAAAEVRRRSPDGAAPAASSSRSEGLALAQAALSEAQRELNDAIEAVGTASAAVTHARARLASMTEKRLKAVQSLQANRAQLQELRTKATVLEERHGTDREPRIKTLDEARILAAAQLEASRARLTKLKPEDLERNRDRIERTISYATTAKQDAETKRQWAKARLELEGTTDPREDLARAAAQQRLAAAEQARATREADAVKLLASLFAAKKRDVEAQFVAPLTNRVCGYLERLYGDGTTVSVDYRDGRFSQLTLSRRGVGDATFDFGQLGSGTKEQVSAAFRLAMAEILAEAYDGSLPVVLDDAFANTDSERQRDLQQMLDLAASRGLQIIVLSCRPTGYAALGAKTVTLADNPFVARDAAEPR